MNVPKSHPVSIPALLWSFLPTSAKVIFLYATHTHTHTPLRYSFPCSRSTNMTPQVSWLIKVQLRNKMTTPRFPDTLQPSKAILFRLLDLASRQTGTIFSLKGWGERITHHYNPAKGRSTLLINRMWDWRNRLVP